MPADKGKARRNAAILAVVFSCPLIAVGILFYVRHGARVGVVADLAIYAAETSSEVNSLLGDPIVAGKPSGSSVTKNGSGNADLVIPLAGPKGRGLLTERAQQTQGKWRLCGLDFQPEHGSSVMLVDETKSHCERE
jgi:hypothetical protein